MSTNNSLKRTGRFVRDNGALLIVLSLLSFAWLIGRSAPHDDTQQERERQADSGGLAQTLAKFFRDNGLTITLLLLFAAFLVGQFASGFNLYNEQHRNHGLPEIGYREFLGTGTFLDGVFANWQAAVLQLASLIIFGMFLYQRGATHSRSPGHSHPERLGRGVFHRLRTWVYDNSLSLAFIALFLASFVLHAITGAASYNEERALSHEPPLSVVSFVVSAKFWFMTFQTWQAEYFAIAVYIVLSIFLRQENSPESKPVDSSDDETGEANK